MSKTAKTTSLKAEVSKAAKLSNIQGGLPSIMRGLPVIAILAGETFARVTNGHNKVEERMLGADEAIVLGDPPRQSSSGVHADIARPGIEMMCQRCAMNDMKSIKISNVLAQGHRLWPLCYEIGTVRQ